MSEQITYNYWCTLGGNTHPSLFSKAVYNGRHFMFHTYWMRR